MFAKELMMILARFDHALELAGRFVDAYEGHLDVERNKAAAERVAMGEFGGITAAIAETFGIELEEPDGSA